MRLVPGAARTEVSRIALAGVVAAVALVVVIGVVVLMSSGGSGQKGYGRLAWEHKPLVFKVKTLPRDRILSGRLRNDSLKEVDLTARKDIRLVDRRGRSVLHTAIFAEGYSRDIYPPRDRRLLPDPDQVRLGYKAKIKPGQTRPITLAWRVRNADRAPVRVELPNGELALPSSR